MDITSSYDNTRTCNQRKVLRIEIYTHIHNLKGKQEFFGQATSNRFQIPQRLSPLSYYAFGARREGSCGHA